MADLGRPTVMTEEVVGKLEQAFGFDCTIQEACSFAGISRDTYYEHCKNNLDFSDRMAKAQDKPFIKAKGILFETMRDAGDSIKFLERRQKSLYALRTEVTGKDGDPLTLSNEELDRRIAVAAAALGKEGISGAIRGEVAKTEGQSA